MSNPTRYFSQFTIEQQRRGLAIDAQVAAYDKRQAVHTAAVTAAKQRLAARAFFAEVGQLPDLETGFFAQLAAANERYFRAQEESLQFHEAGLKTLQLERLTTPLNADDLAIVAAIKRYRDKYRAEPVIHEDMPHPDKLNEEIYAFDAAMRLELEATRTLLTERKPELLKLWDFRNAEETISMGGGGLEVGECADEVRAARDVLAALRAQVS